VRHGPIFGSVAVASGSGVFEEDSCCEEVGGHKSDMLTSKSDVAWLLSIAINSSNPSNVEFSIVAPNDSDAIRKEPVEVPNDARDWAGRDGDDVGIDDTGKSEEDCPELENSDARKWSKCACCCCAADHRMMDQVMMESQTQIQYRPHYLRYHAAHTTTLIHPWFL